MPAPNKNKPLDFQEEWLEENMKELYEEAPCGYLSTLPDGVIFKVNATFSEWLGYDKDELVGKKKFQQLLSIGGQIFYETHHSPLMVLQGFVKELSYEIISKSGERLPMLVNAVQKKDSEGKVLFHRITVFDFSDRKRYEQELLFQKKKAEAAREAKETFLSTVTHEIRTPIHAILSVSDLLLKSDPHPDQIALLETLQFSSSNLLRLINDLLDLSKLNAGQTSLSEAPFSMSALAQSIVAIMQPLAEKKRLSLHLTLDDGLPPYFIGDSLKIGQVITNLIGNAIKFTKVGGVRLTIEGAAGNGDKMAVVFSVTDTGIGIPTNMLEAIFQAFTQASDTIHDLFGGTGLGLTISQRLLTMHGSRLEVESKPGEGSTFHFTLVLTISEQPPSHSSQTLPEQPLHGVKLLLVEDNASNILIASRYFKLWGLDFDIATNGQEAVKLVAENDYDLVLMDLNMPVMDGYEATRHIRNLPNERGRQLPILALTASPVELVSEKLEAAGINGLIGKPFQSSELYGTIKMRRGSLTPAVQPSETTPTLDDALLDLREIREMFNDNDEALLEFFEALLDDLKVVRQDFETAANSKDYKMFQDAAHKIKSFVRIFKPTELLAAMQRTEALYKNEEWEKLPEANQSILAEIGRIVVYLKESSNPPN